MRNSHFVLAGALLLAGCYYIPPQFGTTGSLVSAIIDKNQIPNAIINVNPLISDGGYQTQAVVNKYTQASVDHVTFKLYSLNTQKAEVFVTGAEKEVLLADINNGISFDKLTGNTSYRIKAFAYKATGSNSVDLISQSASADINVTNDTQPNAVSIIIRLLDVPFSAQASSSGITFVDGDFSLPASESLE